MTEEQIRAAMVLPGFCWMPGMLGVAPDGTRYRIVGDGEEVRHVTAALPAEPVTYPVPGGFPRLCPDPADPATGGCLLSMLGPGWVVVVDRGGHYSIGRNMLGAIEATSYLGLAEACLMVALSLGRWGTP